MCRPGRGRAAGAALERAVPQARGLIGIHHEPRRAARVADGSFAWHERTGAAAVLAVDRQRLGIAAPLRSAG